MPGGGWTCCCPDSQGTKRKCIQIVPGILFFSEEKHPKLHGILHNAATIDGLILREFVTVLLRNERIIPAMLTTPFLQGKFTGKRRYTWNVMAWKECYRMTPNPGGLAWTWWTWMFWHVSLLPNFLSTKWSTPWQWMRLKLGEQQNLRFQFCS